MEKAYKWLNSHSRLFLERGYLEEGVSPEERVKEIAKNAENILGIEGFAIIVSLPQCGLTMGIREVFLFLVSIPIWMIQ
jgi:hypothetical protein